MAKHGTQRKGRRKGRRKTGRNTHSGNGGHGTTTASLQRIALLFPPKSLQRVYFHGMWQRTRKRQPSLELENLHNPRHAFQAARELEGAYLSSIMRLPRFRSIWTWKYSDSASIVQAVIDHVPPQTIARMF